MTTPKWLSTALSFILIALILVVYLVVRAPARTAPVVAQELIVNNHPSFKYSLTIGNVNMQVAKVSTPAEAERGLSNSAPLASNQGMLFVFPSPTVTPFWMKDMNYPLDIIWIDADKKVVDISAKLDPSTYPKTFSSSKPIQYVLEAESGFAEKNNIKIGTEVSF